MGRRRHKQPVSTTSVSQKALNEKRIEIQPLEEGGYLAVWPPLQGCHAEGQTIAEAIDNLRDVTRVLLELRAEDGLPVPEEIERGPADPVA